MQDKDDANADSNLDVSCPMLVYWSAVVKIGQNFKFAIDPNEWGADV
jgi:hypothetical protein